jgi:hypothetical protein
MVEEHFFSDLDPPKGRTMNTTDLSELLRREKLRFLVAANGGISLPAAGALYWIALGIAGGFLDHSLWTYAALFGSGLIFPLGLLLSKPMKANLTAASPLGSLLLPAFTSMFLSYPVSMTAAYSNVSIAPLAFSIGMSLHWPVVGWMYGSRVCYVHAPVRAILVTACWLLFPDLRFILIPFVVAAIYLVTIAGIRSEVSAAKSVLTAE